MSRKLLAGLIVWLLLAVACGSEDPAPTASVTAASSGTTTATAAAEPGAESGAVDTTGEAPAQPAEESPADTAPAGTGTTVVAPTAADGSSTADEPTTETTARPTSDEESPTETTAGPTTAAYSGPVSPVTGLPVADVDLLDRKLVAVKMDNHWNAQPQSGIEKADAVYELVVEGGLTRFIALFHNSDSDWLGPMRSARPTDWTLVRPLEGVLLISGGQPWITSKITRNGVALIGDLGPPLTARWNERRAPHNLYVNTYEARRVSAERGYGRKAPPTLFNRGDLSGPEGATASYIFFDWSDDVDVVWRWDGTRYLRSADGEPHLWRSRDGDDTGQIGADVLIVLMAERYTDCPPGEGSCVPAWNTVGENRAIVFGQGRYSEGRWRRESAGEWFRITDPRGNPITVPPGRLWIMIYPETAELVW